MNSFISNITGKIRKGGKIDYTPASLFPILRADQIIPKSEMMNYNNKIKRLVSVPDEYYDMYYRDLINKYIEHVQVMPLRYGEHLGSLIQEGLRHAYLAVKLLMDTEENPPTPIYTYAVFSVALLADSHYVMATQKAMISDEDGKFIDEWCPYKGSMLGRGDYYKLREVGQVPEALLNNINPVLATNIMPEKGMSWLSTDPSLLDMWIAVLLGHEDWAGKLGHLIKLMKLNIKDAEFEAMIGIVPLKFMEAEYTEDAEKFLEWLKEELEEEKITVNEEDSLAHMTNEGMFFDWEKIYERFAAVYSKSPGSVQLGTQFNHLGLSKLSGLDFSFDKVFGKKEFGSKGKFGFLGGADKTKAATQTAEAGKEAKTFAQSVSEDKSAGMSTKVSQDSPQAIIIDPKVLYTGQAAPPAISQGMANVAIAMMKQSQLHQQTAQNLAQDPAVKPVDSNR